jgi:hypothetical protein
MTNLGIGVLLLDVSDAPTPADFCRQGWAGSAGAEGPKAKLGKAFLAGGLIGDVTLECVLGDATDQGELVDHQPDRRVPARLLGAGGFVLADLAASTIDSAIPLGLHAPGSTIASASRKRLPWGVLLQTWMMSPLGSGDAPNGGSPTHGCGSSWLILFVGFNDKNAEKDASSALY